MTTFIVRLQVIFDEEFMGGKSLQGACSQFRGKLCAWSDLLLLQNNPHVQTFTTPPADNKTDHAVKPNAVVAESKDIDTSTNVSEFSYDQIMDDYDDKIDELFALQDITVIMSKLQLGDKKSDGSGYRKLLEIAGANNTLALSQSKQTTNKKSHGATHMLKSMLSVHSKGGQSAQGPQKQPLNYKSVVAGQQHTQHNAQSVKVLPSPSQQSHTSAPAAHHHQPVHAVNSVVDKQAATRMVKHHLNVQPSSLSDKSDKKPIAAPPAPTQHHQVCHQAKANQLMTILKKPVATPSVAHDHSDASVSVRDVAVVVPVAPTMAAEDDKLTSLLHKAKAQQVHGKKEEQHAPHTAQQVHAKKQEHGLPTAPGLPATPESNKLTSLLHNAKAQQPHGKAPESAALPTTPALHNSLAASAVPIAPSLPANMPLCVPLAPMLSETASESGLKTGGSLTSLLSKAKAGMKAKMVEQKSHMHANYAPGAPINHSAQHLSPAITSHASSHASANSECHNAGAAVSTTEPGDATAHVTDAGKKGGVSITNILANAKRVPSADFHRSHPQPSHHAVSTAPAYQKPHSAPTHPTTRRPAVPSHTTTKHSHTHSATAHHHTTAKSSEGKPSDELESKIKKIESEGVHHPDVSDQSNIIDVPDSAATAPIEPASSAPKAPFKPTMFRPTHVSLGKKK
ncbi:hypothetical protein EON65_07805 [archaeon]|nr:MAG: hypothetical protein EON65_07805 [archaeon]